MNIDMNDNQVHCPILLAVQQGHSQKASKLESNLGNETLLKRHEPKAPTSAYTGHHNPHAILLNLLEKTMINTNM